MADFFDDLGRCISEAASEIGKRTEETIEIQKLKSKIRSLKRSSERDYIDMGKAVYEKFQKQEVLDLELVPFCEAIEKREEEIEKHEEEISRIKEEP